MSVKVTTTLKKKIVADSFEEVLSEVHNLSVNKDNSLSINKLNSGKYFTFFEEEYSDDHEEVIPVNPPVLQSLSVTENGTYNPQSGYDGFDTVNVNVPPVEVEKIVEVPVEVEVPANPNLQDKTITENGEYTADEGFDGFDNIVVNVPETIREVEVPVEVEVFPEGYSEELISEFKHYKLNSSVYNGCKVVIEVLQDNTTIEFNAVSGKIEWGDGTYYEITEESKNLTSTEDDNLNAFPQYISVKYDNITHTYDKGTYVLYFSNDFELLNSPDLNDPYGSQEVSNNNYSQMHNSYYGEYIRTKSENHAKWTNTELKKVGGNIIFDLDFSPTMRVVEVEIEEGVETIQHCAFDNCRNLSSINLPESLKTIQNDAFQSCAFTNITLPNSLQYIGGEVFYNCSKLKNIVLPASLESIGTYSLSSVESVKVMNPNPIHINGLLSSTQTLFGQHPKVQSIYVPYSADHSVLNAYKTAEGWSQFADIIYESDPE